MGTNHSLSWWGQKYIQIGCYKKTINQWLKSKQFAIDEGYTKEQIKEYKQYILTIKQLYENE